MCRLALATQEALGVEVSLSSRAMWLQVSKTLSQNKKVKIVHPCSVVKNLSCMCLIFGAILNEERKKKTDRQADRESKICYVHPLHSRNSLAIWLLAPRCFEEKPVFVKMWRLYRKRTFVGKKITFSLVFSCVHKISTMMNASIACELFHTHDNILG